MAKLRHIAITGPDPWKAAEFYMRAFGMEKVGHLKAIGMKFGEWIDVGYWQKAVSSKH